MKIFYDITVLLMTLLSIVLVSMIAITAVRNEAAWCIFFCTAQIAAILTGMYAIRLKRGVKMWHE